MNNLTNRPGPARSAGFTLVELLAVVVMVALLTATLAFTRPDNHTPRCLNNLRQLTMAWRMYAEDNQGRLTLNRDGGMVGKSKDYAAWVGGWLDFTSSTDNTNVDLLINHDRYPYAAYLGPYVKTASVFKCPADKSTVRIGDQRLARVRSISMNNFMGATSRTWASPSRYAIYSKSTQIKSPSKIFVLLDEREDSINDPLFFTDSDNRYKMIDYPASYHDGAGGFSFADGHAEIHHWKDPRTMSILRPGVLLPLNVYLPGDEDIDWLQQHAAEPRQ